MTFSQDTAAVFPRLGLRSAPLPGTWGPVCGSAAWGWVLDLTFEMPGRRGEMLSSSWSYKSRRGRFQMGIYDISKALRGYSQSCKKKSIGRENKG